MMTLDSLPLLNQRAGLPNAAAIIKHRPLRIAYIGGSNTVMKDGWRPRFHEWMNGTYPRHGDHTEINLSIGAIGSLAASFLIPEILQGQRPDVAVIEYALNDFNWMTWEGGYFGNELQPAATTSAAGEGLVLKVKRENPDCDIVFLYMPLSGQLTGKYKYVTDSIAEYEKLAAHYRIPSLFIPAGFRELESREVVRAADYEKTVFRDESHLSPAGLDHCLNFIGESVRSLLARSAQPPPPLPAPLNPLTTVEARPLPVRPGMIEGPYTVERFKNSRFDLPYFSLPAGSRLNVRYTGAVAGIGAAFGPDTPGEYRGVVDGRETVLQLYTRYCVKPHLGSIMLNKDLRRVKTGGLFTCEARPVLPDYSRFPECAPVSLDALRLNVTHLMVLGETL